jgi:hypothetical protein
MAFKEMSGRMSVLMQEEYPSPWESKEPESAGCRGPPSTRPQDGYQPGARHLKCVTITVAASYTVRRTLKNPKRRESKRGLTSSAN